MLYLIKEEARELRDKYADPRRTIISEEEVVEFSQEDLIPHQEVVVTLSQRGYIKRLPSHTYRAQRRGGKGMVGVRTREADAIHLLLVTDTHDSLLFFSNRGKVFSLKCYDIPPDVSRTAKGLPLINLISIDPRELVTAVVAVSDFRPDRHVVLATRSGEVKRTALAEFASVRSSGLIAMDVERADELVGAGLATEDSQVFLATAKGQSIRFPSRNIRASFRSSGGVKGIRLAPGDRVIGMDIVSAQDHVLTITANGFGKRTPVSAYPLQDRGGSGVRTFRVNPKTGEVAGIRKVHPSQELMVISAQGIVLRTAVQDIAAQGRDTQGVSIMKLDSGDRVAAVACFDGNSSKEKPKQVAPS
jgi:DNA gyrase subunit A